ncbi:MAG: cysteine--tRNA ligase [Mycoplasmatales bacterium]
MLKIYNTQTKTKKEFKPLKENEVSLYVCGPTLYGDIHIGNARPIVFFDVVYRFLKSQKINVKYASNITDIDDKIINKAILEGKTEEKIVQENFGAFENILHKLNVLPVDYRPTVTEYMQEIIDFIAKLINTKYAYQASNGDVYFKIAKIQEYGQIANRKIEELLAGSRIEIDQAKENDLDFTLWKKTTKGITWDAPFGTGRPGWHTECVVMIRSIFGDQIDIHGGGMDLKFPHHENENAQNVAVSHQNLANYWLHNGFVNIDNEKMSKSLNNFITVKKILQEYDANVIRLLLLQTNYRQPINLTEDFIKQTQKLYNKFNNFANSITVVDYEKYQTTELNTEVIKNMEDDFNIPNVITLILQMIKMQNIQDFITTTNLLGLKIAYCLTEADLPVEVLKKYQTAQKLLEQKLYDQYQELTQELSEQGYLLIRTKEKLIIKER